MKTGQKLNNNMNPVRFRRSTGILAVILYFSLFTCSFGQSVTIQPDGQAFSDNQKIRKISTSNGFQSFNIEFKGKIEVTDDDKDVKAISPGGYLEISKTTFGSKRSLLIEATSSGLKKEYYEGRSKVNFEPAGKQWLAEILPEVVRSTGIAAESRINRYFKQGGIEAVINEIDRLESDHVRATYGNILLKRPGLSDKDLIEAVNGLAKEISSDYYLADMLSNHTDRFLKNDKTADAYFDAVGQIGSDYYASVVLKGALQNTEVPTSSMPKIMLATKNIGSDYYQSVVLTNVLDRDNLDGAVLAEVISTTRSIGSDYYQTQILSKAMEKKQLSDESFNSLLDAISDVSSDYYMTTVFTKLLDNKLSGRVNSKLILLVDEKMSSDYYASSVLGKIVEMQELDDKTMEQLAHAISGLSSSNYGAEVIKHAAEQKTLNKGKLIPLINAAGSLNSDYYASSALEALAPHVRQSDNEVKNAYRTAAKNIHSDIYYGQAIRAID